MTKNEVLSKMKKGAVGALMVTLITVGGVTFSKYMTVIEGNGSASIAAWNFKTGESTTKIKLVNTAKSESLVNGKIAPNSKGEFKINLNATGTDVDVDYKVEILNETNKPTNLKYNIKGQEKKYNSLAELASTELKGKIKAGDLNKIIEKTIEWTWDYETISGDVADTADSKKASYTFDVKVTGTQAIK